MISLELQNILKTCESYVGYTDELRKIIPEYVKTAISRSGETLEKKYSRLLAEEFKKEHSTWLDLAMQGNLQVYVDDITTHKFYKTNYERELSIYHSDIDLVPLSFDTIATVKITYVPNHGFSK